MGNERGAIYLCSTPYHLLVAIQKAYCSVDGPPDVMVTDHVEGGGELAGRVDQAGIFGRAYYSGDVQSVEWNPRKSAAGRILETAAFPHKRNAAAIEAVLPVDLKKYSEIYLFHNDTWMSHYMQDIKKPYHLLEDSLDSYQVIGETQWSYMAKPGSLKSLAKRLFRCGYEYSASSPLVQDVEVNDASGLSLPFMDKVKEVPRRMLSAHLTAEQRGKIWEIFDGEFPPFDPKQPKALLLTQPIWEDGFVQSEAEQIEAYSNLICKYLAGTAGESLQASDGMPATGLLPQPTTAWESHPAHVGMTADSVARDSGFIHPCWRDAGIQLYIKPHPRDAADYRAAFPDAVILKRGMPAELLDYVDGLSFDIGLCLFSTGLNGLSCVGRKVCDADALNGRRGSHT